MRRPLRIAMRDSSLSARIVRREPLHYDDGPSETEDRPGFVRGGSGLAWAGDDIAVVQDDTNFLGLRSASGAVRALALPRGPGGRRQFDDRIGNKADKLDLESLVALDRPPPGRLLAIGSGSTPARERIAVVELTDPPAVSVRGAGPLYAALRGALDLGGMEINLEGAAVAGDVLRLFHRGNGRERAVERASRTADVDLAAFLAWLDAAPRGEPPPILATCSYDLGAIRGVPFGFTDAAALSDGRLLFLAAAEDSPDAVADGEVLGTRLGVIEPRGDVRFTDLLDESGEASALKAEGVLPDPTSPDRLWVVLDPDDFDVPSDLCEVEISGF